MSLLDQLEAQKSQFAEIAPQDVQTIMGQVAAKMDAEKPSEQALKVGDRIPDFTLPNAYGQNVSIQDYLAKGPVVISFYRGGWCPYCSLELRALQTNLQAISDQGANLIAITPEQPTQTQKSIEEHHILFPVLSDSHNEVAQAFGLVFVLDDILRPIYAKFGIDIPASNGDDSYTLPMPASYVIGQDGIVQYAFVDEDYTKRAEPAELLNEVAKLV